MSRATTTAPATRKPSDRDQFWLGHHAAQLSSSQTAKEYAAAQGLSLHAFYQSRKRLRALELLAPAESRTNTGHPASKSKAVSFSKIAVAKATPEPRFRLEIPGGAALEWAGGEVPESVVSVLERLTRLP